MPVDYSIDTTRGLVFCRAWGVLTGLELREHYDLLTRDPRFEQRFQQLADVRSVVDFALAPDVLEATARGGPFVPGVRRALIADTGGQVAMSRLFADYADASGQLVRVFHDPVEAENWLLGDATQSEPT